jgi:hypothetical protein
VIIGPLDDADLAAHDLREAVVGGETGAEAAMLSGRLDDDVCPPSDLRGRYSEGAGGMASDLLHDRRAEDRRDERSHRRVR